MENSDNLMEKEATPKRISKPVHTDLRKLSMADLESLTGIVYKTLRSRLDGIDPIGRSGSSIVYDSRSALPALYRKGKQTNQDALTEAKTQLAIEQAKKTEVERLEKEGELINRKEFENLARADALAARNKLLGLPSRLAPQLVDISDAKVIAAKAKAIVNEALREIARLEDKACS